MSIYRASDFLQQRCPHEVQTAGLMILVMGGAAASGWRMVGLSAALSSNYTT
jgi:hypothetical protein